MISTASLLLRWHVSDTSTRSVDSPGCCGLMSEMSTFLRILHFNTRYSSLCCMQCSHESPLALMLTSLLYSDTSCLEVHCPGTSDELHFQRCSVHWFFGHYRSFYEIQMLFSQVALLSSYPYDVNKSFQICLPITLYHMSCISENLIPCHLACLSTGSGSPRRTEVLCTWRGPCFRGHCSKAVF
jgi:hypothetical protein